MGRIIINPPREDIAKFGPLAHVTESERERILSVPYGQFKPAIKSLEKDIKNAKKADEKQKQLKRQGFA